MSETVEEFNRISEEFSSRSNHNNENRSFGETANNDCSCSSNEAPRHGSLMEHETISAGQIRARCTSGKVPLDSTTLKLIENVSTVELSDSGSEIESSKNTSTRRTNKKACLAKKSPGLALRLSKGAENFTTTENVINVNNEFVIDVSQASNAKGNNDLDRREGLSHSQNEVSIGELSNYENRLIELERHEKLEKIAKIDLLYQRQIESEMNAIEKDKKSDIASLSSQVEFHDAAKFENMARKKMLSFVVDFSAPPRRKVKSHHSLFTQFSGKSVNLPSVEDGLSSGNVSCDDERILDGDVKNNSLQQCSCSPAKDLTKTPNISGAEQKLVEKSLMGDKNSGVIDDAHISSKVDGTTLEKENVTEFNLAHKVTSESPLNIDSTPTVEVKAVEGMDGNPADVYLHDQFCDDSAENSEIRSHDQNDEDENIDYYDNGCEIKQEDLDNAISVSPVLSRLPDDDEFTSNNSDCDEDVIKEICVKEIENEKVEADSTAKPPRSSSSMTSSPLAQSSSSSHSPSSSSSSSLPHNHGIKNSEAKSFEFIPEKNISSVSETVELVNKDVIESKEIKIKIASDNESFSDHGAQCLPTVPLPYIRVHSGSVTSPGFTPTPPPSLEKTEVFALQPIAGIPLGNSQRPSVHRPISPLIGKVESCSSGIHVQSLHEEKPTDGDRVPAPPARGSTTAVGVSTPEDVELAIRDIKSAILKSKNIKLSTPQKLLEDLPSIQTEPVWITRQPQDYHQTFSRAVPKPQTTKQDMLVQNINTRGEVSSEDEEDRETEDDYVTRGTIFGSTSGQNTSINFRGSAESSIRNVSDVAFTSRIALEQWGAGVHGPNYLGEKGEEKRGMSGQAPSRAQVLEKLRREEEEERKHEPYRCDRYDCYECRNMPDEFEEEEDDEDDDIGDYQGENDYSGTVGPKLDINSPRRSSDDDVTACEMTCAGAEVDVATSLGRISHSVGSGFISSRKSPQLDKSEESSDQAVATTTGDYSTDEETDKLLKRQYDCAAKLSQPASSPIKDQVEQRKNRAREVALRDPSNESVLIEGVLFRANYLGSTQLVSEGQPSKAMRMMQAQEAVGRIKAPEGESQPSTEVDLFVSVEKIMVLNTNLQEIMMDHALRTISYIADIGDILVIMARRGSVIRSLEPGGPRRTQTKICCHVFESDEAQLIAQSIGQAFQVSYVEFLKANGIEETSNVKNMDYQDVLNQQEVYGEELYMLSNKEMQREVIVSKNKGEPLGVVIVESGWGSLIPTVILANMAPSGAAARCNLLNIGDQIISINGISMVGLPLTTCQNYIKAVKGQSVVKLMVVSCAPVVEVLIKRPDVKYQLGFSVQNGVICSLLRGGIAERGGIRVGHRIIEINGQSVVATQHEKIVHMLATSAGEIHMKTMPTSIFHLLTGQVVPHYI